MTGFAQATALRAIAPMHYEGELDAGWWTGRAAHGGYVAAIVLRAMMLAVDEAQRAPRSYTVHFLDPPEPGPVRLRCAVERRGRSLTTISTRMEQDGRPIALALGALSRPRPGFQVDDATMPDALAPDDSHPIPRDHPRSPPFIRNLEMRWAIGERPGSGALSARSGGWMRLAEPQTIDHCLAACLLDAWIPPLFSRVRERFGAPTVDFNVQFVGAIPPDGAAQDAFHLGVFETRSAHEGYFEEDGELWTAGGRLLARSRQLAVIAPLGS